MPRKGVFGPIPASMEEVGRTLVNPLDETSLSRVTTWDVPIEDLLGNDGLRLDASHYNHGTANTLQELEATGIKFVPLSKVADLLLPGQFVRIWAESEEYGVPYLNATDLMSLVGLGVPAAGMRYLSYKSEVDIDELLVRAGWLLMTCSGTIGRVFCVPSRLDGWAATHDLIRIVPKSEEWGGFLFVWLSTPLAQSQIIGHTHGGQIDHVTDTQVGQVLVPEFSKSQVKKVHRRVMDALTFREDSIAEIAKLASQVQGWVERGDE